MQPFFENAFVTSDLTGRPCGIRNVVHGCVPDFTGVAAGLYTNWRQGNQISMCSLQEIKEITISLVCRTTILTTVQSTVLT